MGPDEATGLYDVKRLASLLGVQPSTVRSMKSRGTIPAPTSNNINGGAVWSKEIVEAYLNPKDGLHLDAEVNEKLPSVVDLFSGCGGLSLGFRLAGFRVLAGYDNWEKAVDTYNHNLDHPAYILDLGDVKKTVTVLREFFDGENAPGIIGGPPCQDFSSAGKRKEGARADLTEKYAQVVSELSPPFFIMENVPRAERAGAFQNAVKMLRESGYVVDYTVLDASRCGVPQRRKRLLTFGSKDATFAGHLKMILQHNLDANETTLRDWFGDKLGTDFYYRHPRSYARRAIFSIDEPSPTIRGVNRPIPDGYPGHPGDAAPVAKARPLTTKERAEIQTFPSGFEFVGAKTDVEQMIGNAVPVKLAKYVADGLAAALIDSPAD